MSNNRGNNMTVVVLFLLSMFLFVVAIYVYLRREDNDFAVFAKSVKDVKADLSACSQKDTEIEALIEQLRSAVISLPDEMKKVREEVSQVQDHCARLRNSQIELRDRSYPRKVELDLKHLGPIPVEIHTPTRIGVDIIESKRQSKKKPESQNESKTTRKKRN